MLSMRQKSGLDMFDTDLVASRWTRENYKKGHRIFKPMNNVICDASTSAHVTPTRQAPLPKNEKYKKVMNSAQQLATLMSAFGTVEFKRKHKLLQKNRLLGSR